MLRQWQIAQRNEVRIRIRLFFLLLESFAPVTHPYKFAGAFMLSAVRESSLAELYDISRISGDNAAFAEYFFS